LTPEGDVVALSDALTLLLVQPELRRQMGQASRRAVEERYNWGVVAAQFERIYRQAQG
jgi:glycosyltransferase involved in cell wall biosynthesis